MRRPLFWLLILFAATMLRAEGPVFRHKDGKVDQEFENVYQDIRAKADAADYLPLSGGTMTGDLNMGSNKITALAEANNAGEAVRYEQLYITPWTVYTPTGTWVANTTYTGAWRRVGDTMEVQFKIACSGAPTSAAPTLHLPSSTFIDTAKVLGTTAGESPIDGIILINDAGNAVYSGRVLYNTITSVSMRSQDDAVNGTVLNGMSESAPITFGNGDYIHGFFRVPISGWDAK